MASKRTLGDALHDLISLTLIIGLFIGFRLSGEVRALLGNLADAIAIIPGLGSRLLLIIIAWIIMRIIRKRVSYWIEDSLPQRTRQSATFYVEGFRALLFSAFILWLTDSWFSTDPAQAPLSVQAVRALESMVLPDTPT